MQINLDEKEIYYTGDLNKQQFKVLLDWLKKNDTGWEDTDLEDIQKLNGCDSLRYLNDSWLWELNEEQTKNALELFNNKLEPKRWYKSDYGTEYLIYAEEFDKNLNIIKGYGFGDYGEWYVVEPGDSGLGRTVLATKEEVEERLKQEAIKRGFVKGVEVGCLENRNYKCVLERDIYELYYWNKFCVGGRVIMKNGVWLNDKALVEDVIETTDEVSLSPIFSSRDKKLKKTLKYLLKKDIILTPKQYKKLWKK